MDLDAAVTDKCAADAAATRGTTLRPPRPGLRALLAASVALPPVVLLQGDAAWAQMGTSSNVPPQNVFGGGAPNVSSEPKRPQADSASQGGALQPSGSPAAGTRPPAAAPSGATNGGGGANGNGRSENSADAVRILIEQASYWQSQYQTDKALDALRRALLADPGNADALALQAQIQAERGDTNGAQASLNRLRQARPDDPRAAGIEQSLRSGPIDQGQLSEARRLAQQGRYADAVARYQRLFRGETPPAGLAVEYYQTLGGSEGGFDQAREGLGRIVIANPNDLRAQFAYAQLLTFRETTRDEGIRRLNTLAQSAVVGEQARQALRQALLWLPNDASSVPQLNVYVQRNPDDSELRQKLEAARNPPRAPLDEAGQARVAGFDLLKRGRLREAEASFQKALAANPQDADALGGLGVLRLRQGRTAEARTLLQRAVQIDPEWNSALRGANQVGRAVATGGRGGRGGDGGAGQYREVARLANEGRYDDAESRLRQLMGRRAVAANYLQLGDIQARAGRLGEAEASFRRALELEPRNAATSVGLAGVLIRQNRDAEAEQLYARVGGGDLGRAIGRARAEKLRAQARGIDDPVAQAGLFRQAAEADPSNPWLRLELSRALLRQGRGPEAQRVMDDVARASAPGSEGVQAALIYAAQVNDLDRASQLVVRIPPGARTLEMRGIAERVAVRDEIRQANALGDRAAVRQRLVQAASQPDPTGGRAAEIARTLARQGDPGAARDAIIAGLSATRAPTAQQRAAYAAALLDAGQTADAGAVADSVDRRSIPAEQRGFLAGVENGIAVQRTDKLRQQGRNADAYEALAPRLAADPAAPDLNMALGRLYQADRQPRQALAINEELLRRNPGNMEVRRNLVAAAIQAGELRRADEVIAEIKESLPNDPRVYVMSAEVARARGFNGRALRELRHARELREQQLGAARDMAPRAEAPPFARPAGASPGAGGGDRVARAQPLQSPPQLVPNAAYKAELAQGILAPETAPLANPFRNSSAPTGELQPFTPNTLGNLPGAQTLSVPPGRGDVPADPLIVSIDRDIDALEQQTAPAVQVGLGFRGRSGEPGLSQLFEVTTPLEAQYSPGGVGRLRLAVTPTYLNAGSIRQDPFTVRQFGTNAVLRADNPFITPSVARTTDAFGVGLNVAYSYQFATVDIGSTPLGFREQSVVGGLELAPEIFPDVRLRVLGERRAVTDSVLSYAGERDILRGREWGGAVRNRGRAQLEWTPGQWVAYVGGGGGAVTGHNLPDNGFVEVGGGVSHPVYKTPTRELRLGLNLLYTNYSRNQDFFTFGHGGYFSPQDYFAALVPVTWRHKVNERLDYELGASIGVQTFRQKSAPFFPTDQALQSALQQGAATDPTVQAFYRKQSETSPAGGVSGQIEYKLTDRIRIGGRAGYQRAGNFNEGTALVYARYTFAGAQ